MIKKYRIILIFISFVLMGLTACKSQYDAILHGSDVPAKYALAFEMFEAKKYLKASQLFESLTIATNGTPQDDTVQYYWGLSNYYYGDYTTAESNFSQFISIYPLSPFTEKAKFYRLDCLYKGTYRYELDQRPTYKALGAIHEFVVENPDSEYIERCHKMADELNGRLELKSYKSAYLYYHMEDYLAAHYALKNVLKENADNRYREEVLYYTAMSAYKYASMSVPDKRRERYLIFIDDYFNVISEYPESQYRKELDGLYAKVQKLLKKNSPEENN